MLIMKITRSYPGQNSGRMLVVHSDTHGDDGRALVHNTPHRETDECWMIEAVTEGNVTLGYRLRKSQDRHRNKYLVSRRKRDGSTFWVDVTGDVGAATVWQIDNTELVVGGRFSSHSIIFEHYFGIEFHQVIFHKFYSNRNN